MNKLKKVSATLMALLLVGGTVGSAVACGPGSDVEIDEDKTQLYIANYNGGVGEAWLDEAAARFEEKYKDWKNGDKTGVQVVDLIRHDKSYEGLSLANKIKGDQYEIYFTQQVDYRSYVSNDYLYDITDLVKEMVNVDDGKTIYSKLNDDQKKFMELDGSYYALPHYELYNGISYDAGVFKLKNLYFSDTIDSDGTRKFVANPSAKKSCGPDGEYVTYDDGLPSSMAEFKKLLTKMTTSSVTPFIWTGKSTHYTNMLPIAFYTNLAGGAGTRANFTYDTNGEKVDIITSFVGNEPVIESMEITPETGYLTKSQAGIYYALDMANTVFGSSKMYNVPATSTTFSHTNAQEAFVMSGLDGKEHIAILIDGNYWYNEAGDAGIHKDLKEWYPETYTQKDLRVMPLPRQYEGTVTEGNGKPPVLVDSFNSYALVNAGIDKSKYPLIKEFLSFLYSDAELLNFTRATDGILKSIDYDFYSVRDDVSSFGQSVLDLRNDAKAANTFVQSNASNKIYIANSSKFNLTTLGYYFQTTVNGLSYTQPRSAAIKKISAKDYFNGMQISKENWASWTKGLLD